MNKAIHFSLAAIIYTTVLTSCNDASEGGKNKTTVVENGKAVAENPAKENIITFKAGTGLVTSNGWNISRSLMEGMMVLNITSNMHQEPRTINININGDKAGTYPFLNGGAFNKNDYAYGSYFNDYMADRVSPYNFEDGEFTVTSIDTATGLLNALFHGTVRNSKGETITIADGKVINGKLKPGVTKY